MSGSKPGWATPVKESVSRSMRSNKGRDTGPELALRKALRENGLGGYRIQWKVSGRPDIAYPGRRIAVFVNGCFWHRCPHCNLSVPKSNTEYWSAKFERNVSRDQRNYRALEDEGWTVLVIWECEIRKDLPGQVERIRAAHDSKARPAVEVRDMDISSHVHPSHMSELVRLLKPRYMPVAIYHAKEAPPSASPPTEEHCIVASMLIPAWRDGKTVAATAGEVGCKGALDGLGLGGEGPEGRERLAKTYSVGDGERPGRRYFCSPEACMDGYIRSIPVYGTPDDVVVVQPLDEAESAGASIETVSFLVDALEMSALITMRSYFGVSSAVRSGFFFGCEGVYSVPRHEGEREEPKLVLGMTEFYPRRFIEDGRMTVSMPYSLFKRMDEAAGSSFLSEDRWRESAQPSNKECCRSPWERRRGAGSSRGRRAARRRLVPRKFLRRRPSGWRHRSQAVQRASECNPPPNCFMFVFSTSIVRGIVVKSLFRAGCYLTKAFDSIGAYRFRLLTHLIIRARVRLYSMLA